MELITFDETFSNNNNRWFTCNDEVCSCNIADGKYILDHKRETNDYAVWQTIPLVESRAYSYEASFSFMGGKTTSGFGILWGQRQNKGDNEQLYSGFHYFAISASGQYVVRTYRPEDKKVTSVKDWTESVHINKGEHVTNILKIIKFDDNIDRQLYSRSTGNWCSRQAICLCTGMRPASSCFII